MLLGRWRVIGGDLGWVMRTLVFLGNRGFWDWKGELMILRVGMRRSLISIKYDGMVFIDIILKNTGYGFKKVSRKKLYF